jgi:hypothetical protein
VRHFYPFAELVTEGCSHGVALFVVFRLVKTMRFDLEPVQEPYGGTVGFLALVIDTPTRQVHVREVEEFCSAIDSRLTYLEAIGVGKIALFRFNLHALKRYKPPSVFLDVLCTFFRGRAFRIADNRGLMRPLALLVRPPGGIATSRSEGLIIEATYKICRAFWENESVRASNFVYMDIPTAPSQELMNDFLVGGTGNGYPHANLRVSPTPGMPGDDLDLVQFQLLNVNCVNATGKLAIAEVAKRVLDPSSPATEAMKITVFTANAAAFVAAGLKKHRNHTCAHLGFVPGDRATLALGPAADRYPTLDGGDLWAAALCPSVRQLSFERFRFSPEAVAAATDALTASAEAATTASVRSLSFLSCSIVQPDSTGERGSSGPRLGIWDLAMSMSRPSTLEQLKLTGTLLRMSDVKALCGMLTASVCHLKWLDLGGTTPGGESCLMAAGVLHFFKQLQYMNTLEELKFDYYPLAYMAPTIRHGLKNNYVLRRLTGLIFDLDDPSSISLTTDMVLWARANAHGRGIVKEAAKNPGSRELRERALEVLHKLSNTDDELDDKTRYLCVRILLPSYFPRSCRRGP